jgi:L-ribulose-5-phosphate 3-epimerase
MQGRLSPQVNGKIQAFPTKHWREEFPAAHELGFGCMEWTLDHEGLAENPFMTASGRHEIRELSSKHGLAIPSVTGDCFMQAPFWKEADATRRRGLLEEFDTVARAAALLGVEIIVVPLVDLGRIEDRAQAEILLGEMLTRAPRLQADGVRIAFEIDYPPTDLVRWIADYPPGVFGVNYDTGNSAALGFDPAEEWGIYGHRVLNVHIKDRSLGGTTVPLGEGNCDFASCFRAMAKARYSGNLILQTARAADGHHAGALARYREIVLKAWSAEDGAQGNERSAQGSLPQLPCLSL